jgi:hypothetical protein
MSARLTFCREQEASERTRAEHAVLPNERLIAARSAAAWGREGALIERVEDARKAQPVVADRGASLASSMDDASPPGRAP